MKNKEDIGGVAHSRPCFFAFPDTINPLISWVVPVSSRVEKFRSTYETKTNRYGKCNTIRFGKFLGKEAAFLIQNMCPVTVKYIQVYKDKNSNLISVDGRVARDIIKNATEVLEKVRHGIKLVFPDILLIYNKLIAQ